MAHSAQGFTGTVDQVAWAKMGALGAPAPFRVSASTSWVPSVNTGTARTMNISVGSAYCCGVLDTTDVVMSVSFSANTGSSTRIDALVARFDWTTMAVSFVAISGGVTPPAILSTGTVADNARITQLPGVRYDAVIAYVPITVGVSVLPTSGTNVFTDARVTSTTISGKMWRTSGFSRQLTAGVGERVIMDAARVNGGFTFDTTNDVLTIPQDGLYRVEMRAYATGGPFPYSFAFYTTRTRSGVADLNIITTSISKDDQYDRQQYLADVLPLKAGDGLFMFASPPDDTGPMYWGASEAQGVMVSATYLTPLNGAAAI